MKTVFTFVLLTLCSFLALSQTGKLVGRVLDAKTLEPLPYTNVYINNTTLGTTTNNNGDFVLASLPLGKTELIISFIGYVSQQQRVEVKSLNNKPIAILLNPEAQQLSEVEIKTKRDKIWDRQLKKFEDVFLGSANQCKIINPWVIDFGDEHGITTATASQPLEIENKLLGYKLFFQLKKFGYSATEFSIVGNIRFEEMETTNSSEANRWMENREAAYRGSVRHLMKSIIDQTLTKEGFVLYKNKVRGSPRDKNFSIQLRNLNSIDTGTLAVSTGVNEFKISFKDKVEVHYKRDYTSINYYTDITYPVSWIEVKGGNILVNKDGAMLNPTDAVISGNMSEAHVSKMLPLDYKPGNLIVAQSAIQNAAKRLYEKVYVRTDKPYYYPGDKIWFSAYMNYQTPRLRDTLSKVLYVDLIGPEKKIIEALVLPIDNGRAFSAFSLPNNLKHGTYFLRAYTQWMRNYGIDQFFYKPLAILRFDQSVEGNGAKPILDNLLKITLDSSTYKKRSKVNMILRLDMAELFDVVKGSFSVAVFDETLTVPIEESINIKNSFELTPLSKNKMFAFDFPLERGIGIKGIYLDKKRKARKANFALMPESLGQVYNLTTTINGRFELGNLAFYDSAKFFVQPIDGKVTLITADKPPIPDFLQEVELPIIHFNIQRATTIMDTTKSKILKAVTVSANKIAPSENVTGHADHYLKADDMKSYSNVADAIAAKIPAFKVIFDQTNWFIVWTRGNITTRSGVAPEPVLYIDNVMVTGGTAGDRLMQLSPAMIDHIEANGMIGSGTGANGANGTIYVYTVRAKPDEPTKIPFVQVKGFDRKVTFSAPNYDSTVSKAEKDERTLLYWNPNAVVTSDKPSELFFFTSDQTGDYRVVIEGVTNSGIPIRSEARFNVKE